MVRYSLALLVGVAVAATAAFAVEPVGGGKFNVTAQVDLSKLNRENFASIVTPVAKQQTGHEIVFYDFADTLCEPLASEAADFTKETGRHDERSPTIRRRQVRELQAHGVTANLAQDGSG